uniref:Uncharacterized protein n=1 Tax=Arundo donax TaxID=35708 RepID=A0A0A9CMK0_ARUDO
MNKVPFSSMQAECNIPAAILLILIPSRFLINLGVYSLEVRANPSMLDLWPCPSLPAPAAPQLKTSPSSVTAIECSDPKATIFTLKSAKQSTFVGVETTFPVLLPRPSWPLEFFPQTKSLPSTVTAEE